MSVIDDLRNELMPPNAQKSNPAAGSAVRKKSDFWLNAGIWIANPEDGEPLFVSLPNGGIALDDLKPSEVKGKNAEWIQLAQTKNKVLEFLQKHAASMEPGERQPLSTPVIGQFGIEIYRRNNPAQEGTVEGNPLMASLMSCITSKAA